MQRYFFRFFNGVRWIDDKDGQLVEDLQEVALEARHSLVDMAEELLSVGQDRSLVYEISDARGRMVYRATLALTEEVLDRSQAAK